MATLPEGVSEELTADETALLEADRAASSAPPEPPADTSDAAPEASDASAGDKSAAEDAQPRTVPLAALQEARERAKAIERERDDERRRTALLEERFNLVLRQMQQQQPQQPAPQQQQPEIPPLETDPVGHLLGQIAQRDRVLATLAQAVTGQHQQAQEQQGVQALAVRAQAAEADFRRARPEYDEASQYLIESRQRELMLNGITDPAERHAIMRAEAGQLVARALQRGVNPAEIVFENAKIRGWRPAAAAQPTALAPAAPDPAAATQIDAIDRGQQQARGPGQMSGQRAPAAIDAKRVANMNPREFEQFLKKATPDQMAVVFGN